MPQSTGSKSPASTFEGSGTTLFRITEGVSVVLAILCFVVFRKTIRIAEELYQKGITYLGCLETGSDSWQLHCALWKTGWLVFSSSAARHRPPVRVCPGLTFSRKSDNLIICERGLLALPKPRAILPIASIASITKTPPLSCSRTDPRWPDWYRTVKRSARAGTFPKL